MGAGAAVTAGAGHGPLRPGLRGHRARLSLPLRGRPPVPAVLQPLDACGGSAVRRLSLGDGPQGARGRGPPFGPGEGRWDPSPGVPRSRGPAVDGCVSPTERGRQSALVSAGTPALPGVPSFAKLPHRSLTFQAPLRPLLSPLQVLHSLGHRVFELLLGDLKDSITSDTAVQQARPGPRSGTPATPPDARAEALAPLPTRSVSKLSLSLVPTLPAPQPDTLGVCWSRFSAHHRAESLLSLS